ncbi:MAG: DUF4440 domain-containing protein [Bacteroidota bacterium]
MQDDYHRQTADKLEIDHIIQLFFGLFTNSNQRQPDWTTIHTICIPETLIIKKTGSTTTVYNLDDFIEPRKKILSDGTLIDFEESEIEEATTIVVNIAQRFSSYRKAGYLNGNYFKESGNKLFQFIRTDNGWKINALIWEDDEKKK